MSSNRIRPEYALLLLLGLLATLIPLQLAAPVTTDSDPDTSLDSNWDPADTTISPYTEDSTTVSQAETEVDGQRIDCKLTFDAATMESLGCHNKAVVPSASVGAELGPDSAANKPEDIAQDPEVLPLQMQRHLKRPDSQPIYELQLVVWPSDIEDGDDFSPPLATTTTTTSSTTTTTSTTKAPTTTTTTDSTTTTIGTPIEQIWPLYEDQLVVFPQMDFEEENLDYFFDDVGPSSTTTTPPPPTTPSSTTWHPTGTPTPTPIYVVQNYHVIHPNGTEEYKLVMSNGLVNYKKIYTKTVGDQVVNVQEGYNSVPIPGPRNQIQTQYFIADERGYNVYRIEVSPRQSGLPKNLHYKATKTT